MPKKKKKAKSKKKTKVRKKTAVKKKAKVKRKKSKKIVHCHGVFDLLHVGHIKHLKKAKEFGDKLSDDKKKPIEEALEELKKSYESKELEKIDSDLEKINEAWKAASEEMYKAQQNQQGQSEQSASAPLLSE